MAVGYHGLTNATTAFMYHDGVRSDFGSLWNGATKALAIDNAGRILVRRTLGSVSSFHQVDASDFSMTTIASFGGDVTNIEAMANETGGVAFAWNTNDGTGFIGHLGWWSEQDGFVTLEAPDDSIGVMLRAVNASGWIMGMSHDSDYNLQTFVTTVENDMHIVDDRVIGHESIFMLTAADMNASGQIGTLVTFWGGEDAAAVLSPARPGDADGDGQVNITDLLLIIGLWGEWPAGEACGPDLDMNGLINVEDLLLCIGDWG